MQKPPDKLRILIVDDEPVMLRSYLRVLADDLTEVRQARDGLEALAILEQWDTADAVVADYDMPRMNGIELLAEVARRWPDTARILVTAYMEAELVLDAVNRGHVTRYLVKPIDPWVLRSEVTAVVERRLEVMRRHNDAWSHALLSSVRALAMAIEAKDPYTRGHSDAVATLSGALAERLGMAPFDARGVHLAGVLHDIGKLAVPDRILCKTSALTAEEFAVIRMHPAVGRQILSPISFPWEVPRMVGEHHERWDGSGYPAGLAGEHIHPGARILAVADAYSAMTSRRSYRAPLPIERVHAEFHTGRGRQFAPDVVDALLAMRERLPSTLYPLRTEDLRVVRL